MKTLFHYCWMPAALILLSTGSCSFAEDNSGWKPVAAANYLDQRAEEWFAFPSAERGQGSTRSSCISCHTLAPYALARPLLRRAAGSNVRAPSEDKLLTQARMRVASWKDLDGSKLRLLYDFSDQKKKESWGTEAVVNAAVLAFADRYAGRTSPSAETAQAFANLWKTQIATGEQQGSWDWLDFGNEPLESKVSPYYGAALAALALGTAPGHEMLEAAPGAKAKADLLRGHLQKKLPTQNLFNRAWALWASTRLEGTLPASDQEEIIRQLFAKQQDDGGWRLATLGNYVRHDHSDQASASDGFATGLSLCVLQAASIPRSDSRVLKGIAWLKQNQRPTGEWRCDSVNKKRNPSTHAGKLMSDAATAFAVLALAGQ